MFGFYRLFLAFLVVLLHLYGVPKFGNYAVFAFFILSGFLMTTIMHDQYNYSFKGRFSFSLNRILRLYPLYYYAAFISIVLVFIVRNDLTAYNKKLYLPETVESILSNLTMIFFNPIPHKIDLFLSPATWAITIELIYYALICAGISKSKNRVLVWLFFSLLYFSYTYYAKTATWRYAAIPAGSLPFAVGSYLYFIKHDVFNFFKRFRLNSPYLWLFLFILNPLLAISFESNVFLSEFFFYMNIVTGAALTCVLVFKGFSFLNKKWDSILGEFSYPFYLLHYQAGAIVTFLIFKDYTGAGVNAKQTSIWAIPILFGLSFIGIYLIDKQINLIREKVKIKFLA